VIRTENLTKQFGSTIAVKDVSFEVEENKVTGFLGPNGSGKSTTMRLMLGLDKGRGVTYFDDKLLSDYPNPTDVVGILLDMKAFHPTRTARSHLRVLAAASGLSSNAVDEALDLVGIREVANKQPRTFSLGMSQRLGLAAAILAKPKYLLLDEPANGLDPEGMAWLRNFVKNYATEDRAVLVSSHLLDEISKMAENIVVIGRGKLIAATTMKSLIDDQISQTFIRVKQPKKLEAALNKSGVSFIEEGDGYIIHELPSRQIGELAHKHSLTIYELTPRTMSLENVFLNMTSGAQQFRAGSKEESQ